MAAKQIEQLPPLPATLEEFDWRASAEASSFYDAIETLLKRHAPELWGPFASQMLRAALNDSRRLAYAPLHHILNSIEANCAYARGQNQDQVNEKKFFRVMAAYTNRLDLMQCYLAATELSHLALLMNREQIELQYAYTARSVARFFELFSSSAIPTLSGKFREQYGLTTEDWIRLCFGVFANASGSRDGRIWRHVIESFALDTLKVSAKGVKSFLRESTCTPTSIGQRYRKERQGTKARFHSAIRSVFLDTPIVDFGKGRLLVPHPGLVFRHSGEGLCRLLKSLPGFDDKDSGFGEEFGKTVERYVKKVLSCITDKVTLLGCGELEKTASAESCDLLLETADSILLVESKSTGVRARILTEEVIIKDGSNEHVTKGLVQLSRTAKDIRRGAYKALGVGNSKPIVGMVVTLGEIPFANSEWYFDTFFRKRATERIGEPVDAKFGLMEMPAVISLTAFEMAITAVEQFKISPLELFCDKAAHSHITLGDWEGYLRHKLSSVGTAIDPLPFVTEHLSSFCRSLGIPQEESMKAIYRAQGMDVQVMKSW